MDTNELYFVLINLFCYLSSYDKKKTDAHIERDKYILYHVDIFNVSTKERTYTTKLKTPIIIYFLKYTPFAPFLGGPSSSYKNLISQMQKVQMVEILYLTKITHSNKLKIT